ncbi:PP2C family protein-serine/threonine phosphatase [Planosporangium mesophilum]|uniref:PP2C family protein-serine/threonine phosphatase n=1 Tax=Planosporangium mesophilum TaxID=689768 RepID=UPI00197C7F85|nr:SpoIIE family protein phosphatase [Planosporangium mesophilum]
MSHLGQLERTAPTGSPERLRVLLIEDDPGDAFLVQELLVEARAPVDLEIATSVAEARSRLRSVDCILLDLGLPDASGLSGLRELLNETTGTAVCVLTGLEDEHLGIAAVGEGAQDYLIKGQVDGVLLTRALRYAVERKRADENARRLREAQLQQAESARLERGLLPQPLVDPSTAGLVSFYRPGRHRALLGGDFYDVVEVSPGRLQLLVGDVCGHGVEEAALGVTLRVAWRALVLAQVPDDAVLPALEQVLVSERRSEELFATVAMVSVDVPAGRATIRLAGHPPPVLLTEGRAVPCEVDPGLVLGVLPGMSCPAIEIDLPGSDWGLLTYTDGLIEGLGGDTYDRLGIEGLCALLNGYRDTVATPHELPRWLVGQAELRNGEPLADDVAMLLLNAGGAQW